MELALYKVLDTQDLTAKKELKKAKILVVEDDISLRPIFSRIIRRIDPHIELSWVFSAEKFLLNQQKPASKETRDYDLVITDIYTPGHASGFDIWNHFSKFSPATPVAMMSGLSQFEFFKSMGMNAIIPAYLEKPLDFKECQVLIAGLLQRRSLA